ncbi:MULTISPECIES: M1 family metallopeptidase [Bizionia]|uniref:Aminopeptidase N n=1 Tax=Bizionia algoritergicola TaxID=291187 RepID=A0A5D0QVD4_9FLAO|nr:MULTISPECIES: M1 family metallopeptidase [Bizionia]OBX22836.1 aminopeptidase [Bizionia sp. APA-3]TYB72388.1 M1 family metallopeptidase [Bizionia algoritergicola]
MKYLFALLGFLFSSIAFSQQTDYVDFKQIQAYVVPDDSTKSISGNLTIVFDILKSADSIFLDSQNMTFSKVLLNGNKITFKNDGKRLILFNSFKPSLENKIMFQYTAVPKKALYFVGWDTNAPNQIWSQGQGKYTSNWLPSIDDMNDKLEFDITVEFDSNYQVIANGKLIDKQVLGANTIWSYNMKQPMASYLVALAIGNYDKSEDISESGIPLEMYYYPEDSLKAEPTYRYTTQMFNFLETEIGVSYPWQNYKQVPVHDFLYSGMENTGTTIFADSFVIDSIAFNDRNYVNVNAHELAHQWFGNLVTETSGTHHWLQEGFATYYALLAEQDVFGKNYYYMRLYEYAQELLEQDSRKEGTSLLNPKSSSATFYKKGAWVLHALREKIGDDAFKTAVKNYLEIYQFKNVETTNFIHEAEKTSGQNLDAFVAVWFEAETFPYNEALASLEQSQFIQEYLMADCEAKNAKCDYYLSAPLSAEAKAKIVAQVPERITANVFDDGLKVRQAIAKNLTKIPLGLKTNYESLLTDKSYITIESALYNLWVNFPEKRVDYLNQTKAIVGFNDKNVRLLWLVLALSTPEYDDANKQLYFDELASYTSADYGFEVRQGAFSYLNALQVFTERAILNLIDASHHYNWRFKSFAKNLLEVLSNTEKYDDIIQRLTMKNQ